MKRHDLDLVSLSFGVLLLSVIGIWLFKGAFDIEVRFGRWILAGGLIGFGVLGLLRTWRSSRSSKE